MRSNGGANRRSPPSSQRQGNKPSSETADKDGVSAAVSNSSSSKGTGDAASGSVKKVSTGEQERPNANGDPASGQRSKIGE